MFVAAIIDIDTAQAFEKSEYKGVPGTVYIRHMQSMGIEGIPVVAHASQNEGNFGAYAIVGMARIMDLAQNENIYGSWNKTGIRAILSAYKNQLRNLGIHDTLTASARDVVGSEYINYVNGEINGSGTYTDRVRNYVFKDNSNSNIRATYHPSTGNTYVGPYRISIEDSSRLTAISSNGAVMGYSKAVGETPKAINTLSNDSNNRIYIVIAGNNVSVNTTITLNRAFRRYKARLIIVYSKGYSGTNAQTVGAFAAIEEDTNQKLVLGIDEAEGNLLLVKMDLKDGTRLANVGFKIRMEGTSQYLTENNNIVSLVSGESNGKIFRTNANGEILLKNVPLGKYTFIEVENPNSGYGIDKLTDKEGNKPSGYATLEVQAKLVQTNEILKNMVNATVAIIRDSKGSTSNRQFIEWAYNAVLDREGDTGGINHWLSELNSGKPRTDVIYGMIRSEEFKEEFEDKEPVSGDHIRIIGYVRRVFKGLNISDEDGIVYWSSYIRGYEGKGLYNEKSDGSLTIIKRGTKNNEPLSGVTFRITGPGYDRIHTTGSDGRIVLDGLNQGEYTVVETGINNNNNKDEANYGYIVDSTNIKVTVNGKTEKIVENKYQLSTFELTKIDRDSKEVLANVGFTLQMTSGQKIGQYVGIDSKGEAIYSFDPLAIMTNLKGELKIEKVWPGNYRLTEEINPDKGYEVPQVFLGTIGVQTTVKRTVENIRKYIDLSGYIWEDMISDKDSTRNDIYEYESEEDGDRLLANILVELKDRNGAVIKSAITTGNGSYLFERVEIDKLKDYYIQFTYNGMSYQSVAVNTNLDNGSKASEGSLRDTFNKNFTQIAPGESRDENGNKKYDLNYKSNMPDEHTSSLIFGDNPVYGYEGQNYPINRVYKQYEINATTQNAYNGYLNKIKSEDEIRKQGIKEIKNINLGLRERERPDLAVVKDIESAKVTIAGAEHIYKYADRFMNQAVYESGYDTQVKFGNKYGNMSYTRALYPSDIKYTGSNELDVRITYKIGVRNQSTNINTVVNELADYYDSKYDIIDVGTQINSDGSVIASSRVPYTSKPHSNSEYNKIAIDANLDIGTQEEEYVYVELKVKQQNIIDIVDQDKDVKLDNIVEIVSYSTKDKSGNIYGGIDIDSNPGSIDSDITNKDIYEDDTDKAPGMLLVLQENRITSGQIFLDESEFEELRTAQVRSGNGILDSGEKGIEGVEVKLIDSATSQVVNVYNPNNNKLDKPAVTTTDSNGNYAISGYIPGDYKVVFTWGDKEYTVQDYKGTTVDKATWLKNSSNDQWHKKDVDVRRSDAIDNYPLRENIDDQMELMKNSNKEVINNYEESSLIELMDGSEVDLITKMDSTTNAFKVDIEYQSGTTSIEDEFEMNSDGTLKLENGLPVKKAEFANNIKNVDFGITERARQVVELGKKIKSIKITLANGSVFTNITIDENGIVENNINYAVYLPESEAANGQLKIEIDSEIIQGATLEMEYDLILNNISELDYLTSDYYWYGIQGNESDIVQLTPSKVIDYIDNGVNVSLNEEDEWKVVTNKNELVANGYLSESLKQPLGNVTNVVVAENNEALKPGDNKTMLIPIKTYKVLTTSDDTTFDNEAEIIEVIKTGGSSIRTTPGNYIPSDSTTSEEDNAKSETLIVTPPTGLTTNYIAYVIIAIVTLSILSGTIVVLKLKVSKKRLK